MSVMEIKKDWKDQESTACSTNLERNSREKRSDAVSFAKISRLRRGKPAYKSRTEIERRWRASVLGGKFPYRRLIGYHVVLSVGLEKWTRVGGEWTRGKL